MGYLVFFEDGSSFGISVFSALGGGGRMMEHGK